MQTSRRKFLKTSALSVAGATLFSKTMFAGVYKDEYTGIQLYTVRDEMRVDPLGTLKAISGQGWKIVEHASYGNRKFYGSTPAEFKKILDDLGLKMLSGHTVMGPTAWDATKNDFSDAWKYTVEDAAIVGQKYVISPWLDQSLRTSYDGLRKYMEVFNKCGELCQKSGMKFGYHNHDFEFSQKLNDMTVYDIMLQNTDPKLVIQQLDIGNMYNGGAKALDIVKKYPGRIESMHVKDEIKGEKKSTMGEGFESTILGKGVIPVKEVIDLGRSSGGTTLFIVEQESYQGMKPVDCAKEDLAIMKGWGY